MNDLATLLGSHVSVEWYEAVALVREVTDRLLQDSQDPPPIPELNEIQLSPEGRVTIIGGSRTSEPVRRLGQLLLALLANSDAPVQLRLVVAQATAPTPAYASIRDYSEALGFFERPERSAVLQRLAARAAMAPPSDSPEQKLTLDDLAPLPHASKKVVEKPGTGDSMARRSGAGRFAIVAIVVLALCAGASWYAWSHGMGPHSKTEAIVLADRASDTLGTALVAGASKVTETLGLGRIVPANQAAPPVAAEIPQRYAPRLAEEVRPKDTRKDPIPPLFAFDLDERHPGARRSQTLPYDRRPADLSIPPAVPDDPTVYTVESPGIEPPIGVRTSLTQKLPPGLDPATLTRMELIIGKDGSVESAKLISPPRTVNDGLFVSVAKAWTFQPANRSGIPVRYRKTIWITAR